MGEVPVSTRKGLCFCGGEGGNISEVSRGNKEWDMYSSLSLSRSICGWRWECAVTESCISNLGHVGQVLDVGCWIVTRGSAKETRFFDVWVDCGFVGRMIEACICREIVCLFLDGIVVDVSRVWMESGSGCFKFLLGNVWRELRILWTVNKGA